MFKSRSNNNFRMKVLVIQENTKLKANEKFQACFSIQRAFQKLGHECKVWGLGHEGFHQETFKGYDLILDIENYSRKWIPDLSQNRTFKILWAVDAQLQGENFYDDIFYRGQYNLLMHSTREYTLTKDRRYWFPNAFDEELVGTRPEISKKADIGFCGNVNNRQEYLDLLDENFRFKKDISVVDEKMVEAINSYHIHFNKNITNDINTRNFETIACGTLLLTDYKPDYDLLGFEDGTTCLFYYDDDSLIGRVRELLLHPNRIKEIAANGHELAKEHTYTQRIKHLLESINR